MNEVDHEPTGGVGPEGTIDSGGPPALATGPIIAAAPGSYLSYLSRVDIVAIMPFLYVLVLGIVIYALQKSLLTGPGAVDVRASAVLPLALVALGQTFAIFTRGIDLSVGGVLSLTTAILATHGQYSGAGLILEIVVLILFGAALGALNGIVIATSRLQPFIVTLATWSIWDGVALKVLPTEGGTPPAQLSTAVAGSIIGIPKSVWAVVLLFLLWMWLRNTRFVMDLKAIGSDEGRARLIGLPLIRRKVQVYLLSGALAAAAGVWVTATTASGAPNAGDQFILNSVAAVVVGGTSIFGGIGSGARTIVGAIALLMIPDAIFALNLASFWSVFFQGFLLIVAVTISSVVLQLRAAR
jgi:ribose transport system permease protein